MSPAARTVRHALWERPPPNARVHSALDSLETATPYDRRVQPPSRPHRTAGGQGPTTPHRKRILARARIGAHFRWDRRYRSELGGCWKQALGRQEMFAAP